MVLSTGSSFLLLCQLRCKEKKRRRRGSVCFPLVWEFRYKIVSFLRVQESCFRNECVLGVFFLLVLMKEREDDAYVGCYEEEVIAIVFVLLQGGVSACGQYWCVGRWVTGEGEGVGEGDRWVGKVLYAWTNHQLCGWRRRWRCQGSVMSVWFSKWVNDSEGV